MDNFQERSWFCLLCSVEYGKFLEEETGQSGLTFLSGRYSLGCIALVQTTFRNASSLSLISDLSL